MLVIFIAVLVAVLYIYQICCLRKHKINKKRYFIPIYGLIKILHNNYTFLTCKDSYYVHYRKLMYIFEEVFHFDKYKAWNIDVKDEIITLASSIYFDVLRFYEYDNDDIEYLFAMCCDIYCEHPDELDNDFLAIVDILYAVFSSVNGVDKKMEKYVSIYLKDKYNHMCNKVQDFSRLYWQNI